MADNKSPNIRINKVYTRTGDKGKTGLAEGQKRWKDDMRIEAYGTIDELNSQIGLCRELVIQLNNNKLNSLIKFLKIIQDELFNLGSQLAITKENNNMPKLSENALSILESEIDKINESLKELSSFILPGGSIINSQFHIARNVCRRAERRVVSLSRKEYVDPINICYINRLSDAIFVWSRWISLHNNDKENLWKPNY